MAKAKEFQHYHALVLLRFDPSDVDAPMRWAHEFLYDTFIDRPKPRVALEEPPAVYGGHLPGARALRSEGREPR
jgi:hypothetical protein